MAQLIKANGETATVAPKNGHSFTLDELQELVGGYIENVYLDDGLIMVVNEEGKFSGLPLNKKATDLADAVILPWDEIVGDAVVGTSEEMGGEDDED